jgi:membrane-bound metal-dependent hydrolase YbcI (DUF457 family)
LRLRSALPSNTTLLALPTADDVQYRHCAGGRMLMGHFGVALAAKRVAPGPSLGTLVLAAFLADGVCAAFLLLGWERVEIVPGATAVTPLSFVSYPYTHSLVAGVLWGALLAAAYFLQRRDRVGALWLAALVVSHWVLDFVSHRPAALASASVCGTRCPRRSSSSSRCSGWVCGST